MKKLIAVPESKTAAVSQTVINHALSQTDIRALYWHVMATRKMELFGFQVSETFKLKIPSSPVIYMQKKPGGIEIRSTKNGKLVSFLAASENEFAYTVAILLGRLS